jgi:hypothetical protein
MNYHIGASAAQGWQALYMIMSSPGYTPVEPRHLTLSRMGQGVLKAERASPT